MAQQLQRDLKVTVVLAARCQGPIDLLTNPQVLPLCSLNSFFATATYICSFSFTAMCQDCHHFEEKKNNRAIIFPS